MIITEREWRVQPWKNGRGVTSEIVRIPDRDDYVVRLSVAKVTEPGAFSTFPGYTRWTMKLDGGEIALDRPLRPPVTWLRVGELVEIEGSESITAQLPGAPARLFNVLARPEISVGRGDGAAQLVFSLLDLETRVFEQITGVHGDVVWIRF